MTLIELGLVFCFKNCHWPHFYFSLIPEYWMQILFSWITPTLSSRKYIILIKCSEYMWPRSKFYIDSSHTSVDVRNIWRTYKSTRHRDPLGISDASVLSWDWSLAFPTSSQVLILLLVVQMWWVKNHWFINFTVPEWFDLPSWSMTYQRLMTAKYSSFISNFFIESNIALE